MLTRVNHTDTSRSYRNTFVHTVTQSVIVGGNLRFSRLSPRIRVPYIYLLLRIAQHNDKKVDIYICKPYMPYQ